jgi:hypothetical protein
MVSGLSGVGPPPSLRISHIPPSRSTTGSRSRIADAARTST